MRRFSFIAVLFFACFLFAGSEEEWKSRDATAERLKPFGKLCKEGEDCGEAAPATFATAQGTGLSGKGVYDKFCFACHATGVSEAPLVASDAWIPRVEKGMDVLLTNTKNGFNLLPPMGTCIDCSDAELQAAIDYMVTGKETQESE